MNDFVYITLNGTREMYERSDAIRRFKKAFNCGYESEKEVYLKIINELMDGKTEIIDKK